METIRFTRRRLPHWEVKDGRYFITVRCADSLPKLAVARLTELHQSLAGIPPQSEQFAAQQRLIFRTLEKYLDGAHGACPLRQPAAAEVIVDEFAQLNDWQVAVPHYTIMPNHWHALFVPSRASPHNLSDIMKRLKGRTAKRIHTLLGSSGSLWQGEWFDRWIRSESEWTKTITYMQNNPVKAGLCNFSHEHPWTR